MNKVASGLVFRNAFLFAAVVKKKQMELTLRTPYRTHALIQKPYSLISQDSRELLQNPKTLQSWFKTELPELCTCCHLGLSKSS